MARIINTAPGPREIELQPDGQPAYRQPVLLQVGEFRDGWELVNPNGAAETAMIALGEIVISATPKRGK